MSVFSSIHSASPSLVKVTYVRSEYNSSCPAHTRLYKDEHRVMLWHRAISCRRVALTVARLSLPPNPSAAFKSSNFSRRHLQGVPGMRATTPGDLYMVGMLAHAFLASMSFCNAKLIYPVCAACSESEARSE